MSKRFGWMRWLMLGVVAWGMTACASAEATPPPTVPDFSQPPDLSADAIALGEEVYAAQCASCHGANLEGQANWQQPNPDGSWKAPPHDETGHTWHHGDGALLDAIRRGGQRLPAEMGVSPMPAYDETLSLEEMEAVLVYIKSQWSQDIREMQWQRTMQEQAAAGQQ